MTDTTTDVFDDLIEQGKAEIGTKGRWPICREGDIRIPAEHVGAVGSLIRQGILAGSLDQVDDDPCKQGPDCAHYKNTPANKFCQECGMKKKDRF